MRLANGRFSRFPLPGANGPNDLSALYQDRDGSIWAANYQNMVAHWKNGDYRIDLAVTERIKARVDVIHRDRQGNLWFGGKGGLHRLSSAGEWTHYGPTEGLASQHVKTLVEDANGRIWIGGYGGVSLLENGKLRAWTRASGLPSDRVVTLHADGDKTLWIGSYDGGLYRLRLEDAGWRLTAYTTRDGLYSNQVQQILEDDLGFLWMGCGRGIYRVRKQELNDFANGLVSMITSTHFGKADGLTNLDISGGFQPSGFKARDGRLWFPTQDGIAVIDPRRIPFNPNTPPVIIEECLLDRRNVPFQSGLRIVPGQENLEINYTALSFIKSAQIRFRYKLEGHDRDWTEAGERRTAYYSHLPSGTFTFKVMAANSDGVWNLDGTSLSVTVVPPFYRTLWFRGLAAISLAAALWVALRARIQQLHRRNEQQQAFSWQLIESQEQERKRIAAELHDSLGQQLLVIKNWAMIGINSLHAPRQTRESLDEISGAASQAIEEIREAIYNLRPYQLDKIGLTSTIRYLIERVAAASGIEIQAEIAEIDDLFSSQQQVTFYRVVQECLTNIVKHSKATTARVTITRQPLSLGLAIEDNGCGFQPETVEQGFRAGLGLLGMRERVRILGGKYDIHSVPGSGVKVQVTIDLRQSHERHN
jgi:signal transduction histidine kinase